MKIVELKKVPVEVKSGQVCGSLAPNVTEDCLLVEDGQVIGFYIASITRYERMSKLLAIANAEFLSGRVPKQNLNRADTLAAFKKLGLSWSESCKAGTVQYSTIIGSIPSMPMKRRYGPRQSSVHRVDSAKTFVKAMLSLAGEASEVIEQYMPEAAEKQRQNLESVPEGLRFGPLWTSSISNFNIAARYHIDRSNLPDSLNVIFTKRLGSRGGCLCVPDYGAVFEQPDNSMLVYPAWRNMHGVTDIEALFPGGYRNSIVLYALNLGGLRNGKASAGD